jgi:hypothetical protein
MNVLKIVGSLSLLVIVAIVSGCGGVPTAPVAAQQIAQPSISASASPSNIVAGQSSKLTWNAVNASSVSVDAGIGNVSLSGSIVVSPAQTTVYDFTASGNGKTVTTSVTVTVLSAPTPTPTPTPIPTPNPSPTPSPSPAPSPTPQTSVSVPTWHMDNARTGLNGNEAVLTPANVTTPGFGKLFSYLVDGYLYAQPLYVANLTIHGAAHNVVFAATENETVYAFDADNFGNGSPLWQVSLLQAGEVPQLGGNPLPLQGLTSTPTIDLASNTMYAVTTQHAAGKTDFFRLHALDITTGKEKVGSPVTITASVSGTNSHSVNGAVPLTTSCLQRAALLLSQGTLYIGFSACYNGWLLSYDTTTLAQIAVLNMSPNADGYGKFGGAGGVWMGGGGPVADSAGNVYLSTGNGPYDGGPEWGDSVLRVNRQLQVIDNFTPADFNFLQCQDLDLAAGGVMLIPGESQLVAGGKQGQMFLLNAANLGGMQANDTGALNELFFDGNGTPSQGSCVDNHGNTLAAPEASYSIYGTAAWFNGSIFLGSDPGPVKKFTVSGGKLTPGASTLFTIARLTYGTTPFISANGAANGIIWVLDHGHPIQDPTGAAPSAAILRAIDASNLTHELYNSSQSPADTPGLGIKFTSPIVANGKVFIGTAHDPLTVANPKGELDIYGLK